MEILPQDILRHIFSLLPQTTIVQCRLLNRACGALATTFAFRHVHLEHFRDCLAYTRISESAHLRTLVREVTVDIGKVPSPHKATAQATRRHIGFLVALPQLRLFLSLQALNIKFEPSTVTSTDSIFQNRMLSTILDCITGQWSKEHHKQWETYWMSQSNLDREWNLVPSTESSASPGPESKSIVVGLPYCPSSALTSLATLTLTNLPGATVEHELYTSPSFQAFVSSQPLCALKILVSIERDKWQPDDPIVLPKVYDFFEQLPTTWLSTSLTSNLRVLSLFCSWYFGWAPKLDLRMIRPGPAFPQLRVLALGTYVFTHEWQVHWIASLGADNGLGGLEELYLDDCPIMWRARTPGPLDSSKSNIDGSQIDNSGFPVKESMTSGESRQDDTVITDFELRWRTVLQYWAREMKALKVFKMGSGDWEEEHIEMVTCARTMDLLRGLKDTKRRNEARNLWKRRSKNMVHLAYDKKSMAEFVTHEMIHGTPDWSGMEDGVGMQQRREHILQYVEFDVGEAPTPWIQRDFWRHMFNDADDGWKQYKAVRSADEAAWFEIREAVSARSRQ